eukprot:755102-Prymnesium_polylepis.1
MELGHRSNFFSHFRARSGQPHANKPRPPRTHDPDQFVARVAYVNTSPTDTIQHRYVEHGRTARTDRTRRSVCPRTVSHSPATALSRTRTYSQLRALRNPHILGILS